MEVTTFKNTWSSTNKFWNPDRYPYMKNTFWIILAASITLFACKDPSITGAGLVTDLDKQRAIYTDTLTVVTSTIREDSLRTDRINSTPVFLSGKLDDPTFGKTYGGIFAQLRLPTNNVNLPGSLVLDSVVLTLPYVGHYGDTTSPMSMIVYQVTEDMDPTVPYYSDKLFATAPIEIGRKDNFLPHTTDSVSVKGGKLAPHMRIRLQDNFGDNLLQLSGTPTFANNTVFLDYLKGIYLTPDTNAASNVMTYLDLGSRLAKLTLYYDDSLTFDLPINSSSAKSNYFQHNYSGSVATSNINSTTDSIGYVQSMAGLKMKIDVPYFKDLGKIAINKAELLYTVKHSTTGVDTLYSLPLQMYTLRSDENGLNDFIIDLFEGIGHYGGGKAVTTAANGSAATRYKFNLSLHYQLIADGVIEDHGLYLITFPSSQVGDRVMIGGGNHPDPEMRMKLLLTYTKLD
jgi:hypothetical protein